MSESRTYLYDEVTHQYRRNKSLDEAAEIESIWCYINFISCAYTTQHIRKLTCRLAEKDTSQDWDYDFFSKHLKCIFFLQDLNQSTRISDILGEDSKYLLKDILGNAIFVGSSEEELSLSVEEEIDSECSFDGLSNQRRNDIDLLYESRQMTAHELDSFVNPVEATGEVNVIIRSGLRAGYVTLQKPLPANVLNRICIECSRDPKSPMYGALEMRKATDIYPEPEEYIGPEILYVYIPSIMFLWHSKLKTMPQISCNCMGAMEQGLDPNRYGDLCYDCRSVTLKQIDHGENITPTNIWSDRNRVIGPAINEVVYIENVSEPEESRAPVDYKEWPNFDEKCYHTHDCSQTTKIATESKLDDLFSTPGRKMIDIDHVPAVKCPKWPRAAWEFTVRERPSGWPTHALVQQVVAQGCHVIPRGIFSSPQTAFKLQYTMFSSANHMDWRLSFSVAERILAQNMNEVQVKCYLLFRLLNEVVTKTFYCNRNDEDEHFSLKTYHLKTTFFWVCEEIPYSEWNDDNLGVCFMQVLHKMILFLDDHCIPNYFIPTSNLIRPGRNCGPESIVACAEEYSSIWQQWYRDKSLEEVFQGLLQISWQHIWSHVLQKLPEIDKTEVTLVKKALSQYKACKVKAEENSEILHPSQDLDAVFAQFFRSISRFLYTHGNVYGKGFNTTRASFYENEAKKLIPAEGGPGESEDELSESSTAVFESEGDTEYYTADSSVES